jgi:hypothetical protein
MRLVSLILPALVLVLVYECRAVRDEDLRRNLLKVKAWMNKPGNSGHLLMSKKALEQILAKMVNRFNGVSSPFRLTTTKGQVEEEKSLSSLKTVIQKLARALGREEKEVLFNDTNKKDHVGLDKNVVNTIIKLESVGNLVGTKELKPDGAFKELARMIERKFSRHWDRTVNSFYDKLEYKAVKAEGGKVYILPVSETSNWFMG